VATTGLMHCNKKSLLDHFVGRGKQRRWQLEAKRLRGLKIDEKLKCSGLLDRQVGWLDPFKHSTVMPEL
jgi:hypothetical protein